MQSAFHPSSSVPQANRCKTSESDIVRRRLSSDCVRTLLTCGKNTKCVLSAGRLWRSGARIFHSSSPAFAPPPRYILLPTAQAAVGREASLLHTSSSTALRTPNASAGRAAFDQYRRFFGGHPPPENGDQAVVSPKVRGCPS